MRLIDADELIEYLKKYHSMSQGIISDVEHFPTATAPKRSITDILEDVKCEMCEYCKYKERCIEALESNEEYPCPLDKL